MPKDRVPVVGIGASAGGLEALKALLGAIPADSNAAFVVVTHRDPEGVSLLPQILQKYTVMPVTEATHSMMIEPNHIYVSPPSHYINLMDGALMFKSEIHHGVVLPIDYFFRSLAQERQENAVGIVLSGNGSDGTLGLHEIKSAGGFTMVQDPKTSAYTDMPANAIASDVADTISAPEKMPEILIANLAGETTGTNEDTAHSHLLEEILLLIRKQTGSDFISYKPSTLRRRIERRLKVHRLANYKEYLRYLKDNDLEAELLLKEMLIGVTSFFRDKDAFEILEKEVLPDLLKNKKDGDHLRIWVPGCSTGEEAYSMSILIHEYMERAKKHFIVSIFATDLNDVAIHKARSGIYAEGIALDMSPDRIQSYFSREGSHYRVKKNIREMVVFATQNLIQDPPFTKLDLISCRNLMIYLSPSLQKKIIPMFHYALLPRGVLFLGSSETVGVFTDLFDTIQSRWKIFMRSETTKSSHNPMSFMESSKMKEKKSQNRQRETKSVPAAHPEDITDLAKKVLLAQHIPPSLIVNDKGDIFFIHGRTGLYLEPVSGAPQTSQNALAMAREGLSSALGSIIRKAATQIEPVVHEGVRVRSNGHFTTVNLRAKKISEPEPLRGLLWVSFEESTGPAAPQIERMDKKAKLPDSESGETEKELSFVRRNLQSTIEEKETANEELKTSNEELQSTNEELQSANEELETAKEEMQSLNEELQTVNAELENKLGELSSANDDMKNLLNSTGIATLFLDNDLNIKRFTIQARKIINLIHTDIGRPISDIATQLDYSELVKDANHVLHTLVFKEMEVMASDWSWYLMRIMPYRTAENVIDGLVITFVDITKSKKAEILLAANSKILKMMCIDEAPLIDTLDEVLRTIEQHAPDIRCAVSLLDKDGRHLKHGSSPSLPREFTDSLDNVEISAKSPQPCAATIFTNKHVVISDLTQAPQAEFSNLALKNNIKACWSQPIYSMQGKIIGSFTIYYQQVRQPCESEEELINQTVALMGLAISRQNSR